MTSWATVFLACFLNAAAHAEIVHLDFNSLKGGESVTTQFAPLGISFTGFNNPVVIGGTYGPVGNNSYLGLIGEVANPLPNSLNGIVGIFDQPAYFISFNANAMRIGSSVTVNAFTSDGTLLLSQSFFRADFYKGTFTESFDVGVGRLTMVASDPTFTEVGLNEFHFSSTPIPEPGTTSLLAIGLVGLVAAKRRRGVAQITMQRKLPSSFSASH